MRAWEVQKAVYQALTGSTELMALITEVYDHAPQDAVYPYVVIGEDLSEAYDTDTTLDADHVISVHTWSRYRGNKQAKQIQQAVYAALHRKQLTVDDANYTDCHLESQETFLDDDGLTRHGVQRLRVLIDEVIQ